MYKSDEVLKYSCWRGRLAYLVTGVELDCVGMTGSLTGASSEGWEMGCLLDLSLFKTKLALLMNLANPLGWPGPSEPPWPEELILVKGCW